MALNKQHKFTKLKLINGQSKLMREMHDSVSNQDSIFYIFLLYMHEDEIVLKYTLNLLM